MSRARNLVTARGGGFPRVSGDEPRLFRAYFDGAGFSPRERG